MDKKKIELMKTALAGLPGRGQFLFAPLVATGTGPAEPVLLVDKMAVLKPADFQARAASLLDLTLPKAPASVVGGTLRRGSGGQWSFTIDPDRCKGQVDVTRTQLAMRRFGATTRLPGLDKARVSDRDLTEAEEKALADQDAAAEEEARKRLESASTRIEKAMPLLGDDATSFAAGLLEARELAAAESFSAVIEAIDALEARLTARLRALADKAPRAPSAVSAVTAGKARIVWAAARTVARENLTKLQKAAAEHPEAQNHPRAAEIAKRLAALPVLLERYDGELADALDALGAAATDAERQERLVTTTEVFGRYRKMLADDAALWRLESNGVAQVQIATALKKSLDALAGALEIEG